MFSEPCYPTSSPIEDVLSKKIRLIVVLPNGDLYDIINKEVVGNIFVVH